MNCSMTRKSMNSLLFLLFRLISKTYSGKKKEKSIVFDNGSKTIFSIKKYLMQSFEKEL
jgi:hypothetical protein